MEVWKLRAKHMKKPCNISQKQHLNLPWPKSPEISLRFRCFLKFPEELDKFPEISLIFHGKANSLSFPQCVGTLKLSFWWKFRQNGISFSMSPFLATIHPKNSTQDSWSIVFCVVWYRTISWWRNQMETFSALLALCEGNPPVSGEFPLQRPVTRSFHVFFDLRLNKRLSKQSRRQSFETPSWSLWHRCFPPHAFSIGPMSIIPHPHCPWSSPEEYGYKWVNKLRRTKLKSQRSQAKPSVYFMRYTAVSGTNKRGVFDIPNVCARASSSRGQWMGIQFAVEWVSEMPGFECCTPLY